MDPKIAPPISIAKMNPPHTARYLKARKSTSGGKVWFIDVIGDKTPVDKGNLLSSVVWNLVPVYTAMILDLRAGTFGTHPYSLKLADDSVRLLHSRYIPDPLWSDVEAVRRQIIDGKLVIDPVFDAVKVRALMTSVATPPK